MRDFSSPAHPGHRAGMEYRGTGHRSEARANGEGRCPPMKPHRLRIPVVAAAAVLALAGCSDPSGDGSPTDTTQTASATPGQSPESSDATEPATGASDDATGDASGGSSTDATGRDVDLATTEFSVSAQAALDTSREEIGADGIVHGIELDYSSSRGAWIWEVNTLVDGTDHEVDINADTGEVVDHEQDSTDDKEEAIDLNDPMTFEQALDLAHRKVEGPVRSWKLEWDDGVRAYQFDIGDLHNDQEVTVNVETSAVTVDRD
ncbi:peptidase [Pseudactinotalea sp. HY160]|nr:peptidase [Pseudactinotalea sp. HY160]